MLGVGQSFWVWGIFQQETLDLEACAQRAGLSYNS